ncbi:MAG TPA: TonB-dependent receptor [Cyclobacteriaceae bacterium]|nr:TonB-dependent receptor [Cyclobacteriaceae bacterium]
MKRIIQHYFFLVAIAGSTQVVAQTSMLSGTVKTETNEALVGAAVQLKGTGIGAVTDIDGKFSLEIPDNNLNAGVLMCSYIGFKNKEVSINNQSFFEIVLTEDSKALEEVVVTGYQSEERKKIMGAVSSVSPDLIAKIPVSGIDQAIQGRVPGVVVTQNTGAPGDGVIVRVRGVGSLNSNNQPLYVIDGIPTLDATFIAPQDIQSLTVLKDASAAALYGARAANGVILITTKMGNTNKMSVSYSSQIGVQSPTRLVPMANTKQYISIYNEAANNDNPDLPSFLRRPLITQELDSTFSVTNVDQVKAIMRPTALLQTHSLTFSGGDGKTRYLISGTYYHQEGIIKSSDYTRLTGRVNVESELKKWLKAGVNLNLSGANTDIVGGSGDGAGGNGGSVVRYAYFRSPAIPVYDAAGNFIDLPDHYNLLGDGYNPVGMLAYNQNKRITNRLFGKFYVILKPIEGLTITSNFGVDFTSQNQRRFDRNWGTANRINNPNRLTVVDDRNRSLTFSNFATYTRNFGKNGFTLLIGTEAIKSESYEVVGTDTQFANQSSTLTYLGNGLGQKTNSETKSGNALASFFGKVSYDYNEKYLLSATVRKDGSSRFGAKNRYGTFYAGSVGWRIDKETFLINNTWIDRLMLRAGYGVIGNQEIDNYAFSDAYAVNTNYPFGNSGSFGYAVSRLGNANIKWESSSQLNTGVDLVIWNGKLSVSLDYFNKITSDLLVKQPIALSAGLASPPYVNNGKILNRGFELSLNYTNKIGDFGYSISPNASLIHNEVLAVSSPVQGGQYGSQYVTQTEKGYQVGSFFMYQMDGIFQNQDDIFTHAVQGPSTGPSRIQPGDVKFKDQDGNGVINGNDRAHVGSAIPKVTGGLNFMFTYKGFDLSVFFQGAYGQKILSVLNRDIEGFYRPFNVTERYFTNHWTGEGSTNQYPRASWNATGNNTQISTRFLEDGSYTRLKNLQLGYTVPTVITEKYKLSAVRIYFSATNLFTWSKYSGMDPEMSVSNNSAKDGDKANGIDWGTYPAAKSFNVGLNISF